MESKFLSRKFGLTVGCQLIFTTLLLLGKIDASVFSNLTLFVVGAYLTANVSQRYIEGGNVG